MTQGGTTVEDVGHVTSADGTRIGWQEAGRGPTAVLLHGTSGSRMSWRLCSRLLEPHLRLLAVDRRGRGLSGPGEPYDLEREIDDIAAVVASLDEPPHLIGASYGAVLALAAVQAGVPARSLVLHEPPLLVDEHIDVPPILAACEAALAAGDPGGAVAAFWSAIGEGRALELIRRLPEVYEVLLRDAHTIPRELRAASGFPSPAELAEGVAVPTLLTKGTESHPLFAASVDALGEALPQAQVRVLDGQSHAAMAFGPEAYAAAVLAFLGAR